MKFCLNILNILLAISLFSACGNDEEIIKGDKLFIGNDTSILDNASLELSSNILAKSYEWSTGETSTKITISQEGVYWLKVVLDDNTILQDSIVVETAYRMAKISTRLGEIILWLHPETPLHKEAFLDLVNEQYFDNQYFNRVIDAFVIQGGCPDLAGGFTDTSLFVAPEFNEKFVHVGGALGGGRDNNKGKKTNACQFYIVDYSNNEPRYLDGDYTIFGMVASGKETVETISKEKTNRKDEPIEDISLKIEMVTYTQKQLAELYGFQIP